MSTRKMTVLDVVTRFVIFILVLLFVSVLLRILTRQILIEKLGLRNTFTNIVFFDSPNYIDSIAGTIDWSIMYPFEDSQDEIRNAPNQTRSLSEKTREFKSLINKLEQRIAPYTTKSIIFYNQFLETANMYKRIIGWEMSPHDEYNSVITLENGILATVAGRRDTANHVSAIVDFRRFLTEQGVGLLYVQIPSKISPAGKELSGVVDFSNQNIDEFLSGLTEHEIDFIDIREEIMNHGLNQHDMFYKTDHHWKAETGLWAAEIISAHLNDIYSFDIDTRILNPDNYDYVVYRDLFLGSQGKKVTLSRAKPEDFTIIYPKFDVDLSIYIPERKINKAGGFEVVYDLTYIAEKDIYNRFPYAAYLYDYSSLISITNNSISHNKRILVVRESNANVLVPFLALGIRNIDTIDLRHFNGSLRSFVKQGDYDLVIIAYNPAATNEIDLSFHDNLFDFR